jgi:hypothetical protein
MTFLHRCPMVAVLQIKTKAHNERKQESVGFFRPMIWQESCQGNVHSDSCRVCCWEIPLSITGFDTNSWFDGIKHFQVLLVNGLLVSGPLCFSRGDVLMVGKVLEFWGSGDDCQTQAIGSEWSGYFWWSTVR